MDSNAAVFCYPHAPNIFPDFPGVAGPDRAEKKDPFQSLHERGFLETLLRDRTTGRNIIWATDTYQYLGKEYCRKSQITPALIAGRHAELMSIRGKSRAARTRKHGEVFTPLLVCKIMCDHVFKTLRGRDWKKYVAATVLEITCGEAPFQEGWTEKGFA